MSDLDARKQLRDDIASILQLSRESWGKESARETYNREREEGPFPRSILFKSLNKHPVLSAVAVASIWYLGPAKFGAMGAAAAGLFFRHRDSILPIVQQILSAALVDGKNSNSNEIDSRKTQE